MKKCARCVATLPLSDFFRDRRGVYSARCKVCHGVAVRACVICGVEFEGKPKTKVCSVSCKAQRKVQLRPQTFKVCKHCGVEFGPVDRLGRQYCSSRCAYADRDNLPKKPRLVGSPDARKAQGAVSSALRAGRLTRPGECESCGESRFTEAAHYNYSDPLRIRWLCVPCHRRWDKSEPKGGTIRVAA